MRVNQTFDKLHTDISLLFVLSFHTPLNLAGRYLPTLVSSLSHSLSRGFEVWPGVCMLDRLSSVSYLPVCLCERMSAWPDVLIDWFVTKGGFGESDGTRGFDWIICICFMHAKSRSMAMTMACAMATKWNENDMVVTLSRLRVLRILVVNVMWWTCSLLGIWIARFRCVSWLRWLFFDHYLVLAIRPRGNVRGNTWYHDI